MREVRRPPGLAFSYNGDPANLLERVAPFIDYIEVTPDTLATAGGDESRIDPGLLAALRDAATVVDVVVHGVGLSIASHDGMSQTYLRLLEQIIDEVPVKWHSEHLGYVSVDGRHLGTMVAAPRTHEALDLVGARVAWILDRYGLPFLLENVVHILPENSPQLTDAAFLNQLVAGSGCGLLLDVYNLHCDAHNNAFDTTEFLNELDLAAVHEVHVAGGVEHGDFLLDIHSRAVAEPTLALARRVMDLAPRLALVTFELLDEVFPTWGEELIVRELRRLRTVLLDRMEWVS